LYDLYPEAIESNEVTSNVTSFHREIQTFINTQLTYARQARDRTIMTTRDENGQLPLHKALLSNDITLGSIKLLVKGNPSAVQTPDNGGALPLHLASQRSESAMNGVSDDELQINPFRMNPFREILAEIIESCSKSDTDITSDDHKYTSEEVNQMPITSIISELQVIAQQSDMWISGGGVHTADPAARDNDASSSESKIYNTQQQQDG